MNFLISEKKSKIIIIKIEGEISVKELDFLKEKMSEILNNNLMIKDIERIQVDLSKLEYIDSIGVGFLIKIKKELKAKEISFDLLNTSEIIYKIIKMLSLENYFSFYSSIEEEN